MLYQRRANAKSGIVVFASLKGSPGATCLAAGVMARLLEADRRTADSSPAPAPLLIEADPSGGTCVIRAGLHPVSGLVGLAAEIRGGTLTRQAVSRHVQLLPSGVAVLAGPAGADEATSAIDVLAESLAQFATSGGTSGATVIVDAGRLSADSVVWPLVDVADGVVLLVTANAEGLQQAASWIRVRPHMNGQIALALRATAHRDLQYSKQEIANQLQCQVLAQLPDDEASAMSAFGKVGRRVRRSQWWRSVDAVVEQINGLRSRMAGPGIAQRTDAGLPAVDGLFR